MSWTQQSRIDIGVNAVSGATLVVFDAVAPVKATYSATSNVPCVVDDLNAIVALKGVTGAILQQATNGTLSTGQTTIATSFGSANGAGNTIVAAVVYQPNGFGVPTLTATDSNGNTYTTVVNTLLLGGQYALAIFVATGTVAGANTVTVTASGGGGGFSTAMNDPVMSILEYPGGTGVDAFNFGEAAGGGSLTVNITTTQNNDTLLNILGLGPRCTAAPSSLTGPTGGPTIPGAWYVCYELSGSPATGSYVDRTTKLYKGEGFQHTFNQQLRQRGNASYTLVAHTGDTYEPTQFEPIFLFDQTPAGYSLQFGGILQNYTTRWVGTNGLRFYDCEAVSFECMFDMVYCDGQELYQNQTCGAIIADLYARHVPGCFISLGNIQAGATIAQFAPAKGTKLSDVFSQLAITSQFVWSVNLATLSLDFTAPSITTAPFTLTTEALFDSISLRHDGNDFRNRQGAKLDYDSFSHSAELFIGAGQQQLTLMRPVEQITNAWLGLFTQNTATASFSGQPSPGDTVTIGPASITWQASHLYALGGIIIVSGFTFKVTTAGTSGGTEPNFLSASTTGDTIADGSVIWTCLGPLGLSTGSSTYTFVTALDNTQFGQVLIGATLGATVQNLVDAINAKAPYGGPPYTNGRGVTFSLPTFENSQINAVSVTGTGFTAQQKSAGSGWVAQLNSTGSAFAWSSEFTSGGTSPGGSFPTIAIYVQGTQTQAPGIAYTPGSAVINLATPLDAGSNLQVEYTRADGDIIEAEDTASVELLAAMQASTGKYQQMTDQSTTGLVATLAAAGLQFVQECLDAYGTPPLEPEVIIYQPGVRPGQEWVWSLPSNFAEVNGDWIVTEVKGELVPIEPWLDPAVPGAGHYRYSIKVVNLAVSSSYMDFWENMAGGGTSGGGSLGAGLVATSGGSQPASVVPVELETNSVANAVQTLLNLIAGAGVTLSVTGGNVTISAAASGSTAATKYSQSWTSQTSVTVNHNLATSAIVVAVYDASGNAVVPQDIDVTSSNQLTLTFGASFTGSVVVIGFGGTAPAADFTTSWTSQTSVVANHNLGTTSVLVFVFDGSGNVVTPQNVAITDANNVTLTFGANFSGSVVIAALPGAVRQFNSSWTSQTSFTINHNLGTTAVVCQVYDSSGNQVTPQNILVQDANNVVLSFGASFTGTAVVMG